MFSFASQWVMQHPATAWTAVGVIALHLFGIFADSLVAPDTTSGKAYRTFYKFMQGVAANYSRLKLNA